MAAPAPRAGIEVIVAATADGGIGAAGRIPWRLPSDMAHFRSVTKGAPPGRVNAVVMGRHTWSSIPRRARPLPGRLNVVVSSRPDACRAEDRIPPEVQVANTLEGAIRVAREFPGVDRVFVIGGARLYSEALSSRMCTRVHWTRVLTMFPCDTRVPLVDESVFVAAEKGPVREENGVKFQIVRFERGEPVPAPPRGGGGGSGGGGGGGTAAPLE